MKSKTSVSLAFRRQKVSKPRSFSELKKLFFIVSASRVVGVKVTSVPGLGVTSPGGDVKVTMTGLLLLPFEIEPYNETIILVDPRLYIKAKYTYDCM